MTKVFLFGIDGAAPELIFGRWKEHLPTIRRLMEQGCFGTTRSTIPPLTITAWNSMISGKDPSEIGVFGYTYRDAQGAPRLVNSQHIRCRLLWDILGERKKSIALFVPLSYPVKPINGCMVSDFLTPGVESDCAYPAWLHEKVRNVPRPEAFFDVVAGLAGHKGLAIETLLERTYAMTDMQLTLAKELLATQPWDFFMAVMLGTDRLQHMLWRHFDETHRRHIPNSPHRSALLDYYIYLDKKLAELLALLDEDTVVIVASDHGMVKQEGKINLNNWLLGQGYLVLKQGADPRAKQRFDLSLVDLDRTLAYGSGAYQARVYINRKKAGQSYERIVQELIEKLRAIPDDGGKKLETKVYRKEEIYRNPELPECPDLTVYFDDLRWASNPDFGAEGLYSWETAVGADSAGHSRSGSFLIAGKGIARRGPIAEIDIAQIAPTVLDLLGVPIPPDIRVPKAEVRQ